MSAPPAPSVVVEGCVLFTDLVGFTAYNEVVGDDQAVRVLDAQTAHAAAVLARCSGARIVKELGDGLLIWCGGSSRGVGLAMGLRAEFDAARSAGFPLAVRMGMHCGPVTPRGDDLVGHTVNVAARIAQLAGPGELLVSEEVVSSSADVPPPSVRPVGPTTVKGVSDAIWLYRLGG